MEAIKVAKELVGKIGGIHCGDINSADAFRKEHGMQSGDEPFDVNGSIVTPNVELIPAKLLTMAANLARIIVAAISARALFRTVNSSNTVFFLQGTRAWYRLTVLLVNTHLHAQGIA